MWGQFLPNRLPGLRSFMSTPFASNQLPGLLINIENLVLVYIVVYIYLLSPLKLEVVHTVFEDFRSSTSTSCASDRLHGISRLQVAYINSRNFMLSISTS